MNRNEFIKSCGLRCLGLWGASYLLQSCEGTKYLFADLQGENLIVPLSAFEIEGKEGEEWRSYVVAQHRSLQYPICVYRFSEQEYKALWMRCTHQGTELQVFGDRMQCPAHGSEFTTSGAVQNGPADTPLRSFPVLIESNNLKINLK
jgi:Rieske Fe-S protein